MSRSCCWLWISWLCFGAAAAQEHPSTDPPRRVPARPLTIEEVNRREALTLYGQALSLQHGSNLLQALHKLEKAQRLDPSSAEICRALIPLYEALQRGDDQLACRRRVLELDPADADTAYQLARQLRARGKEPAAIRVLRQAAGSPRLDERPELRLQILFDLAALYEDEEDWPRTARRLREVLAILEHPRVLMEHSKSSREEIQSQAAEIHERLGQIYLKQGRTDEAVASFRAALTADPVRQARLGYNLAEVLLRQGRLDEALSYVNEYLRSRPQGMEGYELKIRLQRKLGQDEEIVPELEAAGRRDPHNTALQLLLARQYVQTGQVRSAEIIYDRLLDQGPTPEVYEGLFALYHQGTREEAEHLLTRFDNAVRRGIDEDEKKGDPSQAAHARAMFGALRKDPELVGRLLVVAHLHMLEGQKLAPRTRLLLGSLAAGTHHLQKAEELYRSCMVDHQGGLGRMENTVYSGLLQVLELQHKYREVIRIANKGLEGAENTHRLLFLEHQVAAYLSLKEVDRALEAADNAVKIADEDNRLHCRLLRASVLSQVGKHKEAIAACKGLLGKYNQAGDVARIRLRLSSIYSAAHEYARSEEQLQRILEADPSNATANNDLGYQWADQNKNLAEAERLIRKALDLDREERRRGTEVRTDSDHDNAAYLDSLGWVLFRRGRLAEARRHLERATELPEGTEDPVVWDHLGDVYFRLHEKARAEKAWKKALDLFELGTRYPDERLPDIQQKLRLLRP